MPSLIRQIPPLNAVLERRAVRGLLRRLERAVVVELVREVLQEEREVLTTGRGLTRRYGTGSVDRALLLRHVEAAVVARVEALQTSSLTSVINATGVLLHTNLGRARLADEVSAEVARVATRPVSLEIDLATGERGSRAARVQRWLCLLTGAPAALVVNNGAAALWLAVHGLARRRRALVSRGEQVAIGGSFRMPELLATTGARVVEVGTTNKTRLQDYARELREGDIVVKIHPSNYRIEGYTEEAGLADLAGLCRDRGARLVFDAGSGSLYNFGTFGLRGEEPVTTHLRQGADLVTFSGDKLLGGPQAGLMIGTADAVTRLARHPMLRALRCDKMTLAALEATLRMYGEGRQAELPLLAAMAVPLAALKRRATALRARLDAIAPQGWTIRALRSEATPGGGSFAMETVSSWEVSLAGPRGRDAQRLRDHLRTGTPSILSRVQDDAVRLDLRGLTEPELETVARRLGEELAQAAGGS